MYSHSCFEQHENNRNNDYPMHPKLTLGGDKLAKKLCGKDIDWLHAYKLN